MARSLPALVMRIPFLKKTGWLLLALLLNLPFLSQAQAVKNSQVQVARQFLLAVLAGNWEAAHQWLSPATQQQFPLPAFRAATQPIIDQARTYGPVIDLYKLGYRLRENDQMQPFVGFSYRADSLRPGPHVQLDVTFPDSTARHIQTFGLLRLRP